MLVFNKYGDKVFLSEVISAGSAIGLTLRPCKSERALVYSTYELRKVSVLLQPAKKRAD